MPLIINVGKLDEDLVRVTPDQDFIVWGGMPWHYQHDNAIVIPIADKHGRDLRDDTEENKREANKLIGAGFNRLEDSLELGRIVWLTVYHPFLKLKYTAPSLFKEYHNLMEYFFDKYAADRDKDDPSVTQPVQLEMF